MGKENKTDYSKVYSFSKIKRFEQCPKSYYFYYLDPEWKGYQEPKDYKTKGTAIHGALTIFYNLPLKQRTPSSLKDSLFESWFSDKDISQKPPLGRIGGFEDISHERKIYSDSLKMLKDFLSLNDINPPLFYMPTKDVKHSFCDYREMIQPISQEYSISGKFDRIDKLPDGTLRIIDFKTGKNHQNRDQLDFYRLLAELNFKIPVGKVSFYYLLDTRIKDFSVSDISLDNIKSKTLENISKINRSKEFPCKPSRLCDYCDFKSICPAWQK